MNKRYLPIALEDFTKTSKILHNISYATKIKAPKKAFSGAFPFFALCPSGLFRAGKLL